jgi:hypothetical protein
MFLEVRGIFPGEAVPVDRLLKALKDVSASEWGYFYIQDA